MIEQNKSGHSLKNNLPAIYHQVYGMISGRTRLNPVKSAQIEQLFKIGDSKVRTIVHYYRFKELRPIVSGNDGYYLARTEKEWLISHCNLKSRAISMLDGLDKITKKNFSGQRDMFGE